MKSSLKFLSILFLLFVAKISMAQKPVNWTLQQLMEPAQLAALMQQGKPLPVILSVGPGALIQHSVELGPASEAEHLQKLKDQLKDLPRDTAIVVYCGCCPFDHCPNVRPAIDALKELKFTNYKLLNLAHNVKVDWVDKGYPKMQ